MIIFKTENLKDKKVYIGHARNNNPNHLGSGKYLKFAIKKFGLDNFKKEILEEFKPNESLSHTMERYEYWINKFKSDNPSFGYNETITETIPKKKRLTRKIQVLISPEDEDNLNSIIIQKSMESGNKPISVSKYVRQLIGEHIIKETQL